MEAAVSNYEEARSQLVTVKEQLVKLYDRINDNIVKCKRGEAELEELEGIEDSAQVYKQLEKIFVEYTAGDLRKLIKEKVASLTEETDRLKGLSSSFMKKLEQCEIQCKEAEEVLAKEAAN